MRDAKFPAPRPLPDVLCLGAAHWDVIGHGPAILPRGADVGGRITQAPGGVALNIATALARQGLRPALLTVLGSDSAGDALASRIEAQAVDPAFVVRVPGRATDCYVALEDPGGLVAAVADSATLEAGASAAAAPLFDGRLGSAARPWTGPLVIDSNLPAALLERLAADPALADADLRLVPGGPGKALRLGPLLRHPRATLYVNLAEGAILAGTARDGAAATAAALVALGVRRVLVTDGPRLVAEAGSAGSRLALPPAVAVRAVTGAGDAFVASHIGAGLRGLDADAAFDAALAAAAAHVAGASPAGGYP